MKSSSSGSRSTRATRRNEEGDTVTTPPQQRQRHLDHHLQEEQGLEVILGGTWNNDDSFSGEEHFLSPQTQGASLSWEESFHLESEFNTPGSRPSSSRDRRKFDSTTPPLIDEEDEIEDEEGAEGDEEDIDFRCTRSESDVVSHDAAARLRRTPGACQMHQSVAGASDSSGISFGAGFGAEEENSQKWPYLSAEDEEEASEAPELGGVSDRINTSRDLQQHPPPLAPATGRAEGELTREPFAFAPWVKSSHIPSAVGSTSASEARAYSPNILRLTEDIGNLLHEDEDDDAYAIEIPNVFRASSAFGSNNGGNGTQGEIMGSGSGEFGGDWTGSYVFEQQQLYQTEQQQQYSNRPGFRRGGGGTVQRPSTAFKDGRTRRRSHTYQQQQQQQYNQSGFVFPFGGVPHFSAVPLQHPRPTLPEEGGAHHQVFEFGKHNQRPNDEDAMAATGTQMLNFGASAFMPPPHQQQQQHPKHELPYRRLHEQQQSFLRPVPSSPVPIASFAPSQFPEQQQHMSPHTTPIFGMASPSLESYQSARPLPPPGVLHPVPHHFGPPHPLLSDYDGTGEGPPIMPHHQSSNPQNLHPGAVILATAHEFLPMGAHSPLPARHFISSQQRPPPHWQQPPMSFEAPPHGMMEPVNWFTGTAAPVNYQHSSPRQPSTALIVPSQGFGGSDASRGQTTPSPRIPSWQSPPPEGTRFAQPPPSTPVEVVPPSTPVIAPLPSSLPNTPNQAAVPSPEVSSQGTRSKKDARKNIRGRKKKVRVPEKPSAPFSPAAGTGTIVKKRSSREAQRAASFASQEGVRADEVGFSVTEDPGDNKRAELEESPATRIAFKDFYRAFRVEEKHSFHRAEQLALKALEGGTLPESVHWRVYLELADLARRSNRYVEARRLYQKVVQLQPYASQGWLEYSKLEEDCGFMNRVSNILYAGLEYCEYSETLLTRAVKHQEKMGNMSAARGILARLKHVGIDKVWRTVLEGALIEGRAGNHDMARRVLKYLMHHVPWYGPLYLEAYKLERDQGHPMDALHIVERGLNTLPRYGPLWFGAFRLYEEIDVAEGQYHLPRTLLMVQRAKCTISKELVWKLHLEAAQMLERTALAYVEVSGLDLESYLSPVRRRLILTILTCPQNLRWKVWLSAGRLELVVGNVDIAHSLFQRAHNCVQQKSKAATVLDCARLAEFRGDVELAQALLTKARSYYANDWKVWFESALVEIRNDNHARAYEIAASGLILHTGSGRLWATLVQLGQLVGGDETQTVALERALSAVPKSGEVWCEGARIHLNPFSCTFDLYRARRYLYFAARFTPQFGDSFIESIRLEVLSQWLYPIAELIWKKTKKSLGDRATDKDLAQYVADVITVIAVARRQDATEPSGSPETKFRDIIRMLRKKLRVENLRSSIDLTELRLSCSNADPNYGALWFHCRRLPTYTPRTVIEHAAEDVADEVFKYANCYLAAMIRRMAVLSTVGQEMPGGAESALETNDQGIINWENNIDKHLRGAMSLKNILNTVKSPGLELLESATGDGSIFITGLTELNKHRPLQSMSLLERRRTLFGTDALFP